MHLCTYPGLFVISAEQENNGCVFANDSGFIVSKTGLNCWLNWDDIRMKD